MAEILKPTPQTLKRAARLIKEGKLVAFPTETVYGLGADAFNEKAVARIFEVKRRPHLDPIIVHIATFAQLAEVCSAICEKAKLLARKFWPGPLTLVLPKSAKLPYIVTAGLESVAVRMPDNEIALRLIEETGTAIAAPSANMFGYLSPTTAQHVQEQLGEHVQLIIDGGPCRIGVESTIIDLTGKPTILRPGGLSVEKIEKVIGKVKFASVSKTPRAPGQLYKHYSPRTRVVLIEDAASFVPPEGVKAGLLAFRKPQQWAYKCIVLSPSGNLREAAANLFSALHVLDKAGVDVIYAEKVPERGLGIAIMDRLRKAQGIKL
jgi:L-threonylcarbamoyladenylate synthase